MFWLIPLLLRHRAATHSINIRTKVIKRVKNYLLDQKSLRVAASFALWQFIHWSISIPFCVPKDLHRQCRSFTILIHLRGSNYFITRLRECEGERTRDLEPIHLRFAALFLNYHFKIIRVISFFFPSFHLSSLRIEIGPGSIGRSANSCFINDLPSYYQINVGFEWFDFDRLQSVFFSLDGIFYLN